MRAAILAGLAIIAVTSARAEPACRTETPSGFPVPRWVSLKSDKINARVGPGEDYRALRTYTAQGLPVIVIAETATWRRVRDVKGQIGWVIAGGTSGRRTALNLSAQPLPLLRRAKPGSEVTAYLGPRAIASLDRCKAGWCRLKAGGETGWAPQAGLWGAADLHCR